MSKSILAINGSTRAQSINHYLIKSIQELTKDQLEINIFNQIERIPHFNPDLDQGDPPKEVIAFRTQLKAAAGILICTPEYAMGIPGTLKNAIDWTVSSCEFYHKPTALITASSSGFKSHAALLDVLNIIEANITEKTQLLISYVKMKVNEEGVKDLDTLNEIKALIRNFCELLG